MGKAGLSGSEAAARLAADGPNTLERARPVSALRLFVNQLASTMTLLLGAAAVVSGVLGELADAIAIVAIVLANAVVGFVQELRAERAVRAMRLLTSPRARVQRDGRAQVIDAAEVVKGDVLLLEAGDVVAADARVLEANVLSTGEATLTGESTAVSKSTEPSPRDAKLADRHDTVFMGTTVATGSGRAEVTHTGMHTELGRVAHLLAKTTREKTPIQVQLAGVTRTLSFACLGVVGVVAVSALLRGLAPIEVLLTSISLAVAAVPEGLPAIVTVALALGAQRLAAHHVLVRRLQAVETLGSTTVICTDKTGTLTRGVMTVREVWGESEAVIAGAMECSDAELTEKGGVGDPTELAILERGRALGLERAELERRTPRAKTFPFDATRKRMSVLRDDGTLWVKGAVDLLLPLCASQPAGVLEQNTAMAARGLRVLAVARRDGVSVAEADPERGLTLIGLIGLADPPRPEAIEAIARARVAGIRTVMMTGDHPLTAAAIAREMKLVGEGESLEGRVYARVTPEEKLEIVRRFKGEGHIVAVTGDGTNDAPALKEAHVGIAMGRTGVEVTREAADLVLTDDDFASIIAAIREGRGIYANIRKALVYLLAGNVAELLTLFVAVVVGLPMPLLALHLLWINLVTDGLPALALVTEPVDGDVMLRAPRPPKEAMLGRRQWIRIATFGALTSAVTLIAFVVMLRTDDVAQARTVAFNVLVFSQMFGAVTFRSSDKVAFAIGFFRNPRLIAVLGVTVLLQLVLIAWPVTIGWFHLAPFHLRTLAVSIAVSLVPATARELGKLLSR